MLPTSKEHDQGLQATSSEYEHSREHYQYSKHLAKIANGPPNLPLARTSHHRMLTSSHDFAPHIALHLVDNSAVLLVRQRFATILKREQDDSSWQWEIPPRVNV